MGEKIFNSKARFLNEIFHYSFLSPKRNRGQVTLFIILAIVIVGIGVAVYMFYPQIQTTLGIGAQSPTQFIQSCLEDQIKQNIETISIQGGSLDPRPYFLYDNQKVEYLCYTESYYEPCVMQQPFLRQHIEEELENSISELSRECFTKLEATYQRQGYDTRLNFGEMDVRLFPEKVITTFNHTLTLTKGGSSERYTDFSIVVNNNLYELASIAISILGFETKYGDAETTDYMNIYHDLKVEKKPQSEGTTVYTLTNTEGEVFRFASRSYIWPSGYGIEGVI